MLGNLVPSVDSAVYVMRHGKTVLDDEKRSDGWLDYPLSDKGRIGLMEAQQYLKMAPITEVYTPSLRRAEETAHIIASGILTHPTLHIADELRTWNMGSLIGTKKKPNKPLVRFFMDHPGLPVPNGESQMAFFQRFLPYLFRLVERAKTEGAFLVVCSGSNLRAIGTALVGDKDKFDLDEGGLMMLTSGKDGPEGRVLFGHKDGEQEDYS
jgi:broad specificity phosphatase PhoE